MKETTEQLLDDLLEDAVPPEFRAAVLDKTLCSARRRKRARRFNMALSATAVAGIFLLSFWKMREPATLPDQIRQPDPMVVNSQPLQPRQIVTPQLDSVKEFVSSASTFTEVRTSGSSGPYEEINDKQLLALLSDRSAILVHYGPHQAELIILNPGN
jgi:hypothetical protein